MFSVIGFTLQYQRRHRVTTRFSFFIPTAATQGGRDPAAKVEGRNACLIPPETIAPIVG